ncbi:hypothetical protein V491_07387 [Pseudogymnoascus sp. VKM F-3775]|nr:hypothetical protein V491_07387 [Pseudogymnoascus sp. VKM F-3775]
MLQIPWTTQINFASALLLHSCITVILKEFFNILEVLERLLLRFWNSHIPRRSDSHFRDHIRTSIVLDAYTSILSHDVEGELAELYFTNTGLVLLAVSLASSVAMNILVSDKILNAFVAATFGFAFFASLVNGEKEIILPILALRRAARFIWSDTPFVNLFSLIYISTVLHGQSTLRLQDYITFRSIAVLELAFMKAKLAASSPEMQVRLMRQLIQSEWVAVNSVSIAPGGGGALTMLILSDQKPENEYLNQSFPIVQRNNMIPFTTAQRLSVMLFKTTVGFHIGCLQGSLGPASCPVPQIGCYIDEPACGLRIYRLSDDIMFLSDCLVQSSASSSWERFILKAHGVLLRQLGKVRVIYLLRTAGDDIGTPSVWHSNVNLVTGVSSRWLDAHFQSAVSGGKCVIA